MSDTNDQMALIVGHSSTGKSMSLHDIKNQARWGYLNTEAGKRLPFKNAFNAFRIEDPWQIHEAFDVFTHQTPDDIDGMILDSVTFMMDMFESQYVIGSSNTQSAWQAYQQFFKTLMQDKVVKFGKPVLMTAHVLSTYNETTLSNDVRVPIKGALKNNGIESYFSTVVTTKKMTLKDLSGYTSSLLTVTAEEEELGYKHVFQTRPTKQTVNESIRSPWQMFSKDETFMDNNAQLLLDRLHEFYA